MKVYYLYILDRFLTISKPKFNMKHMRVDEVKFSANRCLNMISSLMFMLQIP